MNWEEILEYASWYKSGSLLHLLGLHILHCSKKLLSSNISSSVRRDRGCHFYRLWSWLWKKVYIYTYPIFHNEFNQKKQSTQMNKTAIPTKKTIQLISISDFLHNQISQLFGSKWQEKTVWWMGRGRVVKILFLNHQWWHKPLWHHCHQQISTRKFEQHVGTKKEALYKSMTSWG